MENETDDPVPRGRPMPRWMAPGLTVLGIALVFGFGAYVSGLMNTIHELDGRLQSLEGIETVAGELTTIMSSSSLEYVTLSPVTAPDSSLARIFWDRNGMALLLQVFHLPALTPGRQYQLWAVQGDQRIHAGAFLTAGQGVQYFRFDSLTIGNPHGVTTMVITAEPPGNTGAPTGAILLAGSAGVAP